MRGGPFAFVISAAVLVGQMGLSSAGQAFDHRHPRLDLSRIVFPPAPRLLISSGELAAAKQRLDQPPMSVAYAHLRARAERLLGDAHEPRPYCGTDPGVFFKEAHRQGNAARDLALCHHLSGEERFGQRAAAFLRAWSSADPAPGGRLDPGLAASGMVRARGAASFVFANDLLASSGLLSVESEQSIAGWFRQLSVGIRTAITLWERKNYFNRQDYQNHVVAHTAGLALIGSALADGSMVQFALDSPENPRDLRDLIAGTIMMPGDKPHHREPRGWPIHRGEIYDRYRHFTAPNKGLQYCYLSLLLLTATAESAARLGLDFFGYRGPHGGQLRDSFDFYADFYRERNSALKGGFYAGETDRMGLVGDTPALFEVAAHRYPDSTPVFELLRAVDRSAYGSEVFGPAVLLYGTDLPGP